MEFERQTGARGMLDSGSLWSSAEGFRGRTHLAATAISGPTAVRFKWAVCCAVGTALPPLSRIGERHNSAATLREVRFANRWA